MDTDDLYIKQKSVKTNLIFFQKTGGKIIVKGKKKRRIWCFGLCKTRKKLKAEIISLENYFYIKEKDNIYSYYDFRKDAWETGKTCKNTNKCSKSYLRFGNSRPVPGIKIDAVITKGYIRLKNGNSYRYTTSKGFN